MAEPKTKFGKFVKGIDGRGAIDGVMSSVSAVAKISDNISQAKKLDNRGNSMGEVDVLGNTLSTTSSGAQLGSAIGGPLGGAIGAGVGLLGGLISSLTVKKPSYGSRLAKENEYQLGLHTNAIAQEDTFAKQQLMAKNGMNVNGDSKTIEVERDEIVLRKIGGAFKKVADFKGGNTHNQGGEQYKASPGDIIIPRDKAPKIERLLKARKWSAIESERLKLPSDVGQAYAKDGMNVGDPDPKKGTWIQQSIKAIKQVYPNLSLTAIKNMLTNIAVETGNGKASVEKPLKWKNLRSREDLKSIKSRVLSYMAKNNLSEAEFDALPAADRISIQYRGDVGFGLSGGLGALQTTALNDKKVEVMRKIGKELGLNDDTSIRDFVSENMYNSTLFSLKVLEEEGISEEKLNATENALELRKKYINPGENDPKKLDSLTQKETFITKNTPSIEREVQVIDSTIPKNGTPPSELDKPKGPTPNKTWWENVNLEGGGQSMTKKPNNSSFDDLEEDDPENDFPVVKHDFDAGLGKRKETKNIIIHRTAGGGKFNIKDSRLAEKKIGAQAWIEKDGTLHVIGDPDAMLYQSKGGWNENSIGIEIVGKHLGGDKWEPLTPEQEKTLKQYTGQLMVRYKLPPTAIEGHYNYKGSEKTKGEGVTAANMLKEYFKDTTVKDNVVTFSKDVDINPNMDFGLNLTPEDKKQFPTTKPVIKNTVENPIKDTEIKAQLTPDEKTFWETQQGIRHRGTKKGKEAYKINEAFRKKLEVSGLENKTWDETLYSSFPGSAPANFLLRKGKKLIDDALVGISSGEEAHQELRFEDNEEGKKLRREYRKLLKIIDNEETFSMAGLTDTANLISKWTTNLLTGQSFGGSDLYRGANMLAMYDANTVKEIRKKAMDAGLSKEIMYIFEDQVREPRKYFSSNIQGADAVDILTLVANPTGALKGAANFVKTAGKLTVGGVKLTAAGVKNSLNYIRKVGLKKLPSTVLDNVVALVDKAPMYAKGEDMLSILNETEELLKNAPKGEPTRNAWTKLKEFKGTYEEVISLAKDARNSLTKTVTGSTFDELKGFKEKVKATTGLDWKTASKMSKLELAQATKKHMEPIQKMADDISTEMKANFEELTRLKKEMVGKVNADGSLYVLEHPEIVALEDQMKIIANRMDVLNLEAEKIKSKNMFAFDDDFNIIQKGDNINDTKVQMDTYKGITRMIDDMSETYTNLEKVKTAKTAEEITSIENLINKSNQLEKVSDNLTTEKVNALNKIQDLEQLQKEFPEIFNILKASDKYRPVLKNAEGFRRVISQLSNKLREGKDITNPEVIKEIDPTQDKVNTTPEENKEIKKESAVENKIYPNENKSEPFEKVLKKENREEKDPKSFLDTVGQIADYAPAIFNIAKGLEPAEIADRNYVNPQMEQYKNTSQPQLNMIDEAFNAAISNSRNMSGGLMGNYRSNIEKAWAEKINRGAQVNAQETQIATGVAARNVERSNQADQINSQIDSQADMIDMQNRGAKTNFLGAGIQGIADIAAVKRRDKNAQSQQDMLLKLMYGKKDEKVIEEEIIPEKNLITPSTSFFKMNPLFSEREQDKYKNINLT